MSLLWHQAGPRSHAQTHFSDCASLTGKDASLIIPSAITPTVAGAPLATGDEIAVFTSDGICAGTERWAGDNLALAVWGDDEMTPEKDGLEDEEPFSIRVWDSSEQIEYGGETGSVQVTYDDGQPHYRTDGLFEDNAIYLLTSLTASLSVHPPPTLASPNDNATNVASPVTLVWHATPETATYDLQLSTQEDFSTLLAEAEALTDTTYQAASLAVATTYFWRVRARNEAGASDWSPSFRFTTAQPTNYGEQRDLPRQYRLHPNFPNPFNPTTHIAFDLPTATPVTVSIYNMAGQQVARFDLGVLEAGTHELLWDAGHQPSGLFLCRLRAGPVTLTRMVTLLK